MDMESFLPLQSEFEKIYRALADRALLTLESVRQEPFLEIIDRSDYLVTIHDVEYYRPIFINEKLRECYRFENRIQQTTDNYYYLNTMLLSTLYTLIE